MTRRKWSSSRDVARLVRRCLEEGGTVEINGLGVFRTNAEGGFEFTAEDRPQVFLAYSVEDYAAVEHLADALHGYGFDPWLDRRKLMPGQNWPRAIERAIDVSSYFLACFSSRSVTRRGHFHAEMRYALQCARRVPLGEIFFIPVRLEACPVPQEIVSEIQYVDLFPDCRSGIERIVAVMRRQEQNRANRLPPMAA